MSTLGMPVIPARQNQFKDKQKPDDVRASNIAAAKCEYFLIVSFYDPNVQKGG